MSAASRVGLGAAIVLLAAPICALALVVSGVAFSSAESTTRDPFVGGGLYVNPQSTAAKAAGETTDEAEADLFARLAEQPTAIWLVPERNPLGQVGAFLTETVADARRTNSVPLFVIYGIPDRDCGNESRGGLTEAEYPLWVEEIGDALIGSNSVVILEPDSLSLASKCGMVDKRVDQVSSASRILVNRGLPVYLDGGHSNWLPPATQAELLNRAGVSETRGFATNVSNYNTTRDEIAYASEISALTGDSHYVIDVSRNGNGSDGDWCNPPGRAVGDAPAVLRDGAHDANLWVKAPGESDGRCNGGPPAGDWWPENAVELTENAGW